MPQVIPIKDLKHAPAARKLLSEIETIYSHLQSDSHIPSRLPCPMSHPHSRPYQNGCMI